MSRAYVIAEVDVTDAQAYEQYKVLSTQAIAEAGGEVAASLRQGVDNLEQQLNAAVQTAVAGLQQQVQVSQARTSDLRTQLRQAVLSSGLPAEILTNIYSLQQSAEIARSQYQTLLTRQQDLRTQAALQVPDSRVVAEATPPRRSAAGRAS